MISNNHPKVSRNLDLLKIKKLPIVKKVILKFVVNLFKIPSINKLNKKGKNPLNLKQSKV